MVSRSVAHQHDEYLDAVIVTREIVHKRNASESSVSKIFANFAEHNAALQELQFTLESIARRDGTAYCNILFYFAATVFTSFVR